MSSLCARDLSVITCAKNVFKRIKSEKVAEHEAYHILLIRRLREKKEKIFLVLNFGF